MNNKPYGKSRMMAIQRSVPWLAILFCASFQTVNAQININFDTDAIGNPISAPPVFSSTSPLTSLYASLGVTFSGPGAGLGGAILNDTGTFGVSALSGNNFLAFNSSTYAVGPETISFATAMTSVSIYAATSYSGEQFTLQAYGGGSLLNSDVVDASADNYAQLNVASTNGITSVVVTADGPAASWVYDNLSATPAPEPSYLAFSAVGLLGLLIYRWQVRSGEIWKHRAAIIVRRISFATHRVNRAP